MPFNQRYQKAVYWARSSTDEYGNPTVAAPVELTIRWELGLAQEIRPTTNPTAVDATVWVDRTISVGSMFRLGPLESLPSTPNNIYEVVEYVETPSVRATKTERVVLLRKYASALPTVV